MSTPSGAAAPKDHRAWLEAMLRDVSPSVDGERARDRLVEAYFGLECAPAPGTELPPGPDLIGHHPSAVDAVLRFLREAPVSASDTFVDLGAGDGRTLLLARIATGARALGIELQAPLVARGRAAARRLGVEVELVHGDARSGPIEDGTAFFMFTPFVGAALRDVLARLEVIARRRPIVVGALGFELGREAPWLSPRPSTDFWLEIHDGAPR
jgi:SAM-dependent methyltransferase